jgi:hypothetical protein
VEVTPIQDIRVLVGRVCYIPDTHIESRSVLKCQLAFADSRFAAKAPPKRSSAESREYCRPW